MLLDQFIQHQPYVADKLLAPQQHAQQQAALLQAASQFLQTKKYKVVGTRAFAGPEKWVVASQGAKDTARDHYPESKEELREIFIDKDAGALASIHLWRMGPAPTHHLAMVMAIDKLPDGQGLYAYLEVEKIE